jgi:hypothetical protein
MCFTPIESSQALVLQSKSLQHLVIASKNHSESNYDKDTLCNIISNLKCPFLEHLEVNAPVLDMEILTKWDSMLEATPNLKFLHIGNSLKFSKMEDLLHFGEILCKHSQLSASVTHISFFELNSPEQTEAESHPERLMRIFFRAYLTNPRSLKIGYAHHWMTFPIVVMLSEDPQIFADLENGRKALQKWLEASPSVVPISLLKYLRKYNVLPKVNKKNQLENEGPLDFVKILPKELVIDIVFCSGLDAYFSCRLVCKSWKELLSSSPLVIRLVSLYCRDMYRQYQQNQTLTKERRKFKHNA